MVNESLPCLLLIIRQDPLLTKNNNVNNYHSWDTTTRSVPYYPLGTVLMAYDNDELPE